MVGLHRSSSALLSMASLAHWWPVLLLRCSLMSCNCLFRCSSRQPLMLCPWTRDLALGPGLKLCTYRRWFSRPAHQVCPVYWEVPVSIAKLQRMLRFRIGSHLLPIEQGRHLRLPRHRRVCRLCHTEALGDERHTAVLLECPALADLRDEYSPLVAECSGVMARVVWARNQPIVSRYIIACLDRMS